MPRELPFKTRHDDELGEWLPNCETPEGWSKLGTHSSMANFMSWREATNGDIVLSCEQDEHKHLSISY